MVYASNLHNQFSFKGSYHLSTYESADIGSTVGRIKANDGDEGENAEMKYRILDGDGKEYLDIITDDLTQEGVIVVKKVKHSTVVNDSHLQHTNTYNHSSWPSRRNWTMKASECTLLKWRCLTRTRTPTSFIWGRSQTQPSSRSQPKTWTSHPSSAGFSMPSRSMRIHQKALQLEPLQPGTPMLQITQSCEDLIYSDITVSRDGHALKMNCTMLIVLFICMRRLYCFRDPIHWSNYANEVTLRARSTISAECNLHGAIPHLVGPLWVLVWNVAADYRNLALFTRTVYHHSTTAFAPQLAL